MVGEPGIGASNVAIPRAPLSHPTRTPLPPARWTPGTLAGYARFAARRPNESGSACDRVLRHSHVRTRRRVGSEARGRSARGLSIPCRAGDRRVLRSARRRLFLRSGRPPPIGGRVLRGSVTGNSPAPAARRRHAAPRIVRPAQSGARRHCRARRDARPHSARPRRASRLGGHRGGARSIAAIVVQPRLPGVPPDRRANAAGDPGEAGPVRSGAQDSGSAGSPAAPGIGPPVLRVVSSGAAGRSGHLHGAVADARDGREGPTAARCGRSGGRRRVLHRCAVLFDLELP